MYLFMNNNNTSITEDLLNDAQSVVRQVETVIDHTAAPVRQSIVTRFPALFLLLVTFGVTLTLFGIQRYLEESWLNAHPWVAVFLGVVVLTATGSLYKKLG